MLAQAVPIGISINSPATWFVVAVAGVVLALTLSTRRRHVRAPAAITPAPLPTPSRPVAMRLRYVADWAAAQALFVENPRAGFERARTIVASALCDRLDVDGAPDPLGERYSAASETAAHSDASTEELREAFLAFGDILDRLLAAEPAEATSNRTA